MKLLRKGMRMGIVRVHSLERSRTEGGVKWEGETTDGDDLRVTFRWGVLSARVGSTGLYSAMVADDGVREMTEERMRELLEGVLDFGFEMGGPMTFLQALNTLYVNEINVRISSFWDGGWSVQIGDEVNGFKANFPTRDLLEATPWLVKTAKELYPHFEVG